MRRTIVDNGPGSFRKGHLWGNGEKESIWIKLDELVQLETPELCSFVIEASFIYSHALRSTSGQENGREVLHCSSTRSRPSVRILARRPPRPFIASSVPWQNASFIHEHGLASWVPSNGHSLNFELFTDPLLELHSARYHISPEHPGVLVDNPKLPAHLLIGLPRKKSDLTFIVVLVIEKAIAYQALARDAFNLKNTNDRMCSCSMAIMPIEIVPGRDVNAVDSRLGSHTLSVGDSR